MILGSTTLRTAVIRTAMAVANVGLPVVVVAQGATSPAAPLAPTGWLSSLDTYGKVFGAVLTGLGTLFGLPIVVLNFKKTRAEIRKLELEAEALAGKAALRGDLEGGTSIQIVDSHDVNVQVLADPRFLGPLLLLLDFILAWVVLTLAGYFLSLFGLGIIRTVLLALLAAMLLIPIAKEAWRVRKVLRPSQQNLLSEDSNERRDKNA